MSTVSSVQAVGTPTATQLAQLNATNGAQGGQTALGESDFLNLLSTQLENQDPLNPMSDTDFVSQMATFSQLSAQDTLNTNFQSFTQAQAISSAQGFMGETVSVSGAAEGAATATGTVTGVTVSNGAPELTINGSNYALSDVTSIQPASASSSNTSSSNATPTIPTTSTTPGTSSSSPTN